MATFEAVPQTEERVAPEEAWGILGVFFGWVIPVFRRLRAKGGGAMTADLPPIPQMLLPSESRARFDEIWADERQRAERAGRKPSLKATMFRFLSCRFALTVVLVWVGIACNLGVAVLVGGVVQAVSGEISARDGFLVAVGIFCCIVFGGVFTQRASHNQIKVALIANGALNSAVFRKPAAMTTKERAKYTEGQIINFSAVDGQAVLEVSMFLGFYALVPLQLVVCTVLLYLAIGNAFFLGFAILGVNVILVERVGNQVKKLQVAKNKLADQRNVVLNEALQGVRTIKLLAWERAFTDRVLAKRSLEVENLKTTGYKRGWQSFLSFGLPTLATVATFLLYGGLGNDLDPALVFTSLGLFEYLNMALVILPNMINEIRRLFVSLGRIEGFLAEPDSYDASAVNMEHVGLVKIEGGDFFWSGGADAKAAAGAGTKPEETKDGTAAEAKRAGDLEAGDAAEAAALVRAGPKLTLRGVDFVAQPGNLVCVVGKVSSGKTTLASAVLGLIGKAAGSVYVGGRTAYVAQQPFVMNDTVKQNIMFGAESDDAWYDACVAACALGPDIAAFVAGDETQVGERGITISGGQKQRVALARACYARPDVVVLDDPLSAMDAHVGRKVFEDCILGLWRRTGVTVVLVTNQLWVCDRCDEVYLLEDGTVQEKGAYEDLIQRGGRFSELMANVTGGQDAASQEGSDGQEAEQEEGGGGERQVGKDAEEERPEGREGEDGEDGEEEEGGQEAPPQAQGAAEKATPAAGGDKKGAKKGQIMTLEKRTAGRVGLQTTSDLARAADAPGLGAFVAFVTLASPIAQYMVGWALSRWTQASVDAEEDGDGDGDLSNAWVYVYSGLGLAFAGLAAARSVAYNAFFVQASTVLHNKMLDAVFASPMALFDTTPVGRILNRFQQDMTIMDVGLPRLFELWSFLTGVCAVAIVLAGILVPPMLPAAFAVLAFGVYIYAVVGSVALDLRKLSMISASPMLASLSGFVAGLDSIRAFGRVESFARRYERSAGDFLTAFYWMRALEEWVNAAVVTPVMGLFIGGLAAVLVAMRDSPLVSESSAGLALSYASLLGLRVPAVIFISTALEQLLSSAQRLIEYIGLPPERDVELDGEALAGAALDAWPRDGSLASRGLELRYRPELPLVLKGVDFAVRSGERIGVVGRTGAGKSTLSLAAFRMAPIAGGAFEVGGVDVRRVPLAALRDRVGMIPQDAWLFSGTVRENLDPFERHSDEQIYRALDLVSCGDHIRSLDDGEGAAGLAATVSEKGDNFSSGMVQLLCLARVLLRQPRVVFMDEATASVDLETDMAVQKAIRSSDGGLGGSTLLTVAHRLHTVVDFDKILVMSGGTVAEFGHPHELLQNPASLFASLVDDTGAASAAELRSRARQAFQERDA